MYMSVELSTGAWETSQWPNPPSSLPCHYQLPIAPQEGVGLENTSPIMPEYVADREGREALMSAIALSNPKDNIHSMLPIPWVQCIRGSLKQCIALSVGGAPFSFSLWLLGTCYQQLSAHNQLRKIISKPAIARFFEAACSQGFHFQHSLRMCTENG